jgi:hypothetical protein
VAHHGDDHIGLEYEVAGSTSPRGLESVEATEAQRAPRWMRTPWGSWALGVFLAGLFYIGGYDNSGREPACFGDFPSQHPEAVEYRGETLGFEQTCSAISWTGRVIAVKL